MYLPYATPYGVLRTRYGTYARTKEMAMFQRRPNLGYFLDPLNFIIIVDYSVHVVILMHSYRDYFGD